MQKLLDEILFRDRERARCNIERLAAIPETVAERIQILLPSVPDPDLALHFTARLWDEARPAFERFSASVTSLRYFITLASYSNFLAEAVLRRPEWLLEVVASSELHRVLAPEEFENRLEEFLGTLLPGVPDPIDLARFRRRQLLRIVLRDVLGVATLSDVAEEISNLAAAILEVSFRRIRDELILQHGHPRCETGGRSVECAFAVIALGKLGGKELNYSSDIDLMFLYGGTGETDGPQPVSNKEFYKKVANRLTELLSTYTPEGVCYRVDLRLRPDGRLGEVVHSLDGALSYYRTRGRDWELQMLIKARAAAGDRRLGCALLDAVEPLIYRTTLDFSAVESMAETRDRIRERTPKKDPRLNLKLTPGGIRDIEFLVQCLQRLHGGRESWVRHGGTLFALHRLRDKNFLSDSEFGKLASAYQFLRHLEHRLQFYDDRQRHTLPKDPVVVDIVAREMPVGLLGMAPSAEMLRSQLQAHLENVQEIYNRVIHAQQPMYYDMLANWGAAPLDKPARSEAASIEAPPPASNLTRFLDQIAPGMAQSLSQARLHRGRLRFEHFLERVLASPDLLARLNGDPELVRRVVDIFEHSQYFGDQLIRNPELLDELAPDAAAQSSLAELDLVADTDALRRFFRRRMLALQGESVCGRAPIFETLVKTSDLADAVVAAAYRLALERAKSSVPPADLSYDPCNQMMVVALGRLGMREFDLASDADLVFVIPDSDAGEQLFWTRVAERMINLISAYTGEGTMFTVDTRLRPNGREGALVQTEAAYKNYFGTKAEAWEGITYMKSRAVAGNVERGTGFLNELQEVDWRRYGQPMRSRQDLKQMRLRLEKEQGARNALKAGYGGFYDIDFALLYLRLKGAGIFYKVLNTPARIDVVEQMGHLEPSDAWFLRDAATFYRAIDHGLRIYNGQPEGDLPTATGQLEVLTELVHRWTPERLHNRTLDEQLTVIRGKTREFFDRLFR